MANSFQSLGLSSWITRQIEKLGLRTPTVIQEKCIPEILNGENCLGQAKTGSGKTFAFALPILEKLGEEPRGYFALILTPTHELAHQISEQFSVAGHEMGVRVSVISGGTDQIIESQKLQNRPHIIVAMPGRLADHLSGCNTLPLDRIQFLVIDEADRVLGGSFDEALQTIAEYLPKKRQNVFFSATLNEKIKNNPIFPMPENLFECADEDSVATVDTLDQRYVLCAEYNRDIIMIETLTKYKEDNEDASIIIFTNTKKDCQLLSMTLNSIDMKNTCLHGFMRQKERVAALSNFRSKQVDILIATDVASRGLDIPNVALVLNHQLPRFPNEYIHRVGRTARQGREGIAISLFCFPRDMRFLADIESLINVKLTEHKIDQHSVEKIFVQVNVAKREAELKLSNKDFDERINNYRKKKWISEGLDPDEEEEKLQRIKDEREKRQSKRVFEKGPIITDDRFQKVKTKRFKKKKSSE